MSSSVQIAANQSTTCLCLSIFYLLYLGRALFHLSTEEFFSDAPFSQSGNPSANRAPWKIVDKRKSKRKCHLSHSFADNWIVCSVLLPFGLHFPFPFHLLIYNHKFNQYGSFPNIW